MAKLAKTMFREYDLRGRVNKDELNEDSVKIIAQGFASFLNRRQINTCIVGYDGGMYAQQLTQAYIQSLVESGLTVTNIGMVLTPIFYFSQYPLQIKGGTMITASHNPGEWSGMKFASDLSHTLMPEEMQELWQIIEKDEFISGHGRLQTYPSIIAEYTQDLLKKIKINRQLKVVIDAGNGTAGPIVPPIFKQFGLEVVELFCDLDPTFPNHNPNPSEIEGLKTLQKTVVKEKADVGIALDGDGDRLGIVDEKGQIIHADRYLILLARQVLQEKPMGKIIYDVKCSQALEEDIRAHGGHPIMWKTGHSYIKNKLWEEQAPLAGEMSGHIFFRDHYGFDDGTYACLKLVQYLANQKSTLSALMADTPNYESTPTLNVNCPDEVKYEIVEKLTEDFKNEYPVIDINGARVQFGDGWGLVRASSNLPSLVLRFEAKTEDRLEEIQKLFKVKMAKYPQIGKDWHTG